MNRYTLYITEDQTRKTLELGAPIVSFKNALTRDHVPHFKIGDNKEWTLYFIPTAEQVVNWLEEQGILIDVTLRTGIVYVYDRSNKVHVKTMNIPSRKEATIAAIDAALDYLSNNKK